MVTIIMISVVIALSLLTWSPGGPTPVSPLLGAACQDPMLPTSHRGLIRPLRRQSWRRACRELGAQEAARRGGGGDRQTKLGGAGGSPLTWERISPPLYLSALKPEPEQP